ncbi:MAG TPA: decaprenyl-phosphate phosphoribosyltransferase [Candidatus Polarisedimenticolaceae bacterium]|nr:decaprenyl-phosphate phosphoribosyltransferase [Candidatus Polarisedimenticolaceae bacterium]
MERTRWDEMGAPAWRVLRPRQWVKNVFVLAPLVFAQELGSAVAVETAFLAFVLFCVLSSSVYVLNDLVDAESDRQHPDKRHRPIASGQLDPRAAGVLAASLALAGLAGSLFLGVPFALVAAAYLALNLAYSFALKHMVIVDVMAVAAGFILRAWAGALVLHVALSRWLVLCTGLLALFLGFVKRRQELIARDLDGGQGRAILREYSADFLDQMISVVTASTVVAYSLYAFDPEVARKLGTEHLGLTVPFVLFGIFRYLYLVHRRGQGENPTVLLLGDRPLLINLGLWAGAVVLALYVWK